MCLLAYKPAGKTITEEVCRRASKRNNDGFGVGFISKSGQRITTKSMKMDPKKQSDIVNSLKNKECIIHWRLATHGGEHEHLCHPFQTGINLLMGHNGIFSIPQLPKEHSDTSYLAEKFKNKPTNDVIEGIKQTTGYAGSKVVLLGDDKPIILNEQLGNWKDGIWWSNETGHTEWTYYNGYNSSSSYVAKEYIYHLYCGNTVNGPLEFVKTFESSKSVEDHLKQFGYKPGNSFYLDLSGNFWSSNGKLYSCIRQEKPKVTLALPSPAEYETYIRDSSGAWVLETSSQDQYWNYD